MVLSDVRLIVLLPPNLVAAISTILKRSVFPALYYMNLGPGGESSFTC